VLFGDAPVPGFLRLSLSMTFTVDSAAGINAAWRELNHVRWTDWRHENVSQWDQLKLCEFPQVQT